MKSKIILGILLLGAAGAISYRLLHKEPCFILENIQIDNKNRIITGNCIEGAYLGEMIIPVPDSISIDTLKDGITIKVYGGPAMTMSLPPQLMTVKKIIILNGKEPLVADKD